MNENMEYGIGNVEYGIMLEINTYKVRPYRSKTYL